MSDLGIIKEKKLLSVSVILSFATSSLHVVVTILAFLSQQYSVVDNFKSTHHYINIRNNVNQELKKESFWTCPY